MTTILFLGVVLFWGSSAIVTSMQASAVAPELSVAFRMLVVGICMFGFAIATDKPTLITRADRVWVGTQGVLFFGLAFIAFYNATTVLPSGVAALVLSSSSFFAAFVGRILLDLWIGQRALIGIGCGFAGLAIVAAPQFFTLGIAPRTAEGFGWATLAAASTGAGTVIAARNQQRGIPIATLMGWGALCGATFALAWSILAGISFTIALTPSYLAGLAYLALISSCVTFMMYFTLVEKIGPAHAAYALSVVPVIAIILSALFEGLHVDIRLAVGSTAILIGNILVLKA